MMQIVFTGRRRAGAQLLIVAAMLLQGCVEERKHPLYATAVSIKGSSEPLSDQLVHEPIEAKGVLQLGYRERPPTRSGNVVEGMPTTECHIEYGILVSEDGSIAAAWIEDSNVDAAANERFLSEIRARPYKPYIVHGKATPWKARLGWAWEPLPPAPDIALLSYAQAADETPDVRAERLKRACSAWRILAAAHPESAALARSTLRQLESVARLFGDSFPETPETATPGEEPLYLRIPWLPSGAMPQAAYDRRIAGRVKVEIELDENGVTRSAKVVESSDPIFEKSGLACAMLSRYAPGTQSPRIRIVDFPIRH